MKKFILFLSVVIFMASCKKTESVDELPTNDNYQANNQLAKASATISVPLPIFGNYSSSYDLTKWYNTTGSPAHKAYSTFDDSLAYDINLQSDLDRNLPVLAPFSGTVTKLGTTFPGTSTGGTYGAVLIDIGSGNFVGFMHMKNIAFVNGDRVSAGQQIGTIGNVGATNNHLHFSYYTKNTKGVLISKSVTFVNRQFSMPLSWKNPKVVLKVNGYSQITGAVPFGAKGTVENTLYYVNTYWSSDDNKIASVDGNGNVRGIKTGTTTIRLKFSGQEFVLPVTVY